MPCCAPLFDKRWWWTKREKWPHEVKKQPDWESKLIHGHVAPGWEPVREEFVQNFRARGELGAGVCVYHRGVKVVDLWGGYRDVKGSPWESNTLVPVFSCTKGITMMAMVLQHSRGRLDFDEKVAAYWPDFAQHGKGEWTVRQLMNHECGLAGPTPAIKLDALMDKDKCREFFAAIKPEWPTPGDYKGYMALTLGNFQSALIQMTDEENGRRTAGQFLRDEIFTPLHIDSELYVGLPKEVPDERLAVVDSLVGLEPLFLDTLPPGLASRLLLKPWSYTARAFNNPRLSLFPSVMDYNKRKVKEAEYPAANGQATARALAAVYSAAERAINTGGEMNPLGFSQEALAELMAPAKPSRLGGWRCEVMQIDVALSHGMMKPPPKGAAPGEFCAFGVDQRAFGTTGAGGSFSFCDPGAGMAFAYVMNRCGEYTGDDPRQFALRLKAHECASRASGGSFSVKHLQHPVKAVAKHFARFKHLRPL